ncbi:MULTISPECIES: AbrB family transcriptional regulator [unclassified Corynebacterium]|uniref:AbrB family transcriptional regulator n=1 Tax=unclassified Corynebacterium TaxID=2624378 RepID=UPI001EF4354E|nr:MULTISPECIES: AbrB family transcriptional regulator [unclassified Corynebacterium]MCG7289689.1 AbrB family transcriptional regulator [Corynebacterium sp. ACRPZ]MCG7293973.1 AbrB family transcriptional regulator [Corynebacterium sp. ACRPY]
MPHINRWLVAAPLSVALGLLFSFLGVPAAWILAGILGAGSVALVTEEDLPVNEHLFTFARGTVGVFAALPLVGMNPLPYLLPGVVAGAVVIGMGFVGGLILANHGVSRETGVLSLLPGGASLMPAIARDVGADIRYVSLSQYLRLLIVSVSLPLVASQFTSVTRTELDPYWWMWLLVPALIVAGVFAGKLLKFPNPSVFGPMALTVLVGVLVDVTIVPPRLLSIVGFLAIGWMCGGGLNVPALRRFSRLLPATLAYIAGLMLACAGMGWLMSKWLGLSFYEGYLATSPGALETVLVLATSPAVVALQVIRLIMVILFAGWLPRILKRL